MRCRAAQGLPHTCSGVKMNRLLTSAASSALLAAPFAGSVNDEVRAKAGIDDQARSRA
jgi:hypothetical protein